MRQSRCFAIAAAVLCTTLACSSSSPRSPVPDGAAATPDASSPLPSPDSAVLAPVDSAGPDAMIEPQDSGAADAVAPDGSSSSSSSSSARFALTDMVKIMVLGSSNETGTCWRAFLWQKLRAAGAANVDFVGRTSTGPDCGVAGYDKDVEASPGRIITGFSANEFAMPFQANPPQIVLVHVGGADARNGIAVSKILAAYSLAVEQARMVNPKVVFFVGQHTPQVPATGIHELNAAIPGWAAQISTSDSPVFSVDLFTGIVPASDQSDGTHLNVAGSQKVSDWFLAAMLPLFKS